MLDRQLRSNAAQYARGVLARMRHKFQHDTRCDHGGALVSLYEITWN